MPDALDIPPPPWTLQDYVHILDALSSRGLRTLTIEEFHRSEEGVWLRHDVEVDLLAAVEMARVEADRGVCAHYFICPASPVVADQQRLLRTATNEIRSLGHVVGVHVQLEPFATFDERLVRDGVVVGVDATKDVSIHAPGLPAVFLAKIDRAERVYKRLADGCQYYSDSTGSWRWGDPVKSLVHGTPNAQLLTHPYWWSRKDGVSYHHHATANLEFRQFMPQLHRRIFHE
jgi:hypothetical protein